MNNRLQSHEYVVVYCKSDLSLATEIGRVAGFGGDKEAVTTEYSLCPTHVRRHLHAVG